MTRPIEIRAMRARNEDFAAYDRLPRRVRRAIAEFPRNVVCASVLDAYRRHGEKHVLALLERARREIEPREPPLGFAERISLAARRMTPSH